MDLRKQTAIVAYYLNPLRLHRHKGHDRLLYWLFYAVSVSTATVFYRVTFTTMVFITVALFWFSTWTIPEEVHKRNQGMRDRRRKEFKKIVGRLLPQEHGEATYRDSARRPSLDWKERKRLQEQLALFRRYYPEFFEDTPLTLLD